MQRRPEDNSLSLPVMRLYLSGRLKGVEKADIRRHLKRLDNSIKPLLHPLQSQLLPVKAGLFVRNSRGSSCILVTRKTSAIERLRPNNLIRPLEHDAIMISSIRACKWWGGLWPEPQIGGVDRTVPIILNWSKNYLPVAIHMWCCLLQHFSIAVSIYIFGWK